MPVASRLIMSNVSNAMSKLTPRSSFQVGFLFLICMVREPHGPSGNPGGVACKRFVTGGLAWAIVRPARTFRDDRFENDFVIVTKAPVCGSLFEVCTVRESATLGINV